MPTPVLLDQGNTYRCGIYSVRAWFEGYGYTVVNTATWNKYTALADSQQGLAFTQVHDAITELAAELGINVGWWNDGYIKDFPNFDQLVRDKWCVIIGVYEADIHPGQNFYHYICIYGEANGAYLDKDSFHLYDGDTGQDSIAAINQAIRDNWDNVLIGLAFNMQPAAITETQSTVESLLHQIGDLSYKITPQNETTIGIQKLVQDALRAGGWPV